MILVPGNWIVYNCIGLALRISNVGWYLCEIVTGTGEGAITFILKERRLLYKLRYRLDYLTRVYKTKKYILNTKVYI